MILLEAVRQARRRRTVVTLLVLVGLPVLLAAVLRLTGPDAPDPGRPPQLLDLAGASGLNFAFFLLAATSGFALIVVVALFCGDTVASEASWGSLRYLLVRPVPRSALLRAKLLVAVGYSVLAVALVPLVGLAVGSLAFGWGGLQAPLGASLPPGAGILRLLGATAYVMSQLAAVGALAFLFGVRTDAPLGAVGGAVLVIIVSEIFDGLDTLGAVRAVLPTYYSSAWTDWLADPVRTERMARGVAVQVVYATVLLVLAWRHFARKDVLS